MSTIAPLLLAGAAGGAVIIGIAIGAVGIGGVLLVPFLALTLGLPVQQAIAAALLGYLPSGLVAVWLYARRRSIPWREALWVCLAAPPAAYLGALAARLAPAMLLEALIGGLLLAGGLHTLRRPGLEVARPRPLAAPTLGGAGALAAFVSALTGAGGAFVLVPLLLLLETPVLAAIGLGQAIQIPIAAVASIANLRGGLVHLPLAAVLAAALALGIAIGTPIAHALPQRHLGRLLGTVVTLAGMAMLARSALKLVTAL